MAAPDDAVARVVAVVRAAPKYRAVAPAVVARVAERALAGHPRLGDAVRATKNRLHQAGGAFLDGRPDYAGWLAELRRARAASDEEWRAACRRIMRHHASTRERLAVLERFYAEVFAAAGPVRSLLDVACGLGPLAIPWMPLAAGGVYHACDMYEDLVAFLNAVIPLAGVEGGAAVCDASDFALPAFAARPADAPPYDLALLLKLVPCLDRLDPGAAYRLVEAVPARCLAVSFPVHSLGRRRRWTPDLYRRRFEALTTGREWAVTRLEFPTELVFVVRREGTGAPPAARG
jgi:16S rRNA (guanine(1405)-N(7))-methyltransferase